MRRDERDYDPSEGAEEIAAIETQWTRLWQAQGGPQGQPERIKRREEFKIMWPYIERLPKGSRLLDGGCGGRCGDRDSGSEWTPSRVPASGLMVMTFHFRTGVVARTADPASCSLARASARRSDTRCKE